MRGRDQDKGQQKNGEQCSLTSNPLAEQVKLKSFRKSVHAFQGTSICQMIGLPVEGRSIKTEVVTNDQCARQITLPSTSTWAGRGRLGPLLHAPQSEPQTSMRTYIYTHLHLQRYVSTYLKIYVYMHQHPVQEGSQNSTALEFRRFLRLMGGLRRPPTTKLQTQINPKGSRNCPFKDADSKNHTRYSFWDQNP